MQNTIRKTGERFFWECVILSLAFGSSYKAHTRTQKTLSLSCGVNAYCHNKIEDYINEWKLITTIYFDTEDTKSFLFQVHKTTEL